MNQQRPFALDNSLQNVDARKLFCLIQGQSRRAIFPCQVPATEEIGLLKDVIHAKGFTNVGFLAKDLILFKVDIDPYEYTEDSLKKLEYNEGDPAFKELYPLETVSSHWPSQPHPPKINVFVRPPASSELLSVRICIAHDTPFSSQTISSFNRQLGENADSISPSNSAHSDLSVIPDKLQAFYNDSWGKDWPTRKGTISIANSTSLDDVMDVDVTSDDNINIKRTEPTSCTWEYTCLVKVSTLTDVFDLNTAIRDVVVVRDEYAKLWKELEADKGSFVLTGQPGIGKTCFLIYLLLCRLQQKLPTAIQFDPKRYIFFDEDGVHVCHHSKRQLPDSCWALSDSNEDVLQPCRGFRSSPARVMQTTSPRPDRWRDWFKYARSCRIVIVDPPNQLEIAAIAKELTGHSASDVINLVDQWGPCTRTIVKLLETPHFIESLEEQVAGAANTIGQEPLLVPSTGIEELDSRCSSLVFIYPVRDSNSAPSARLRRDIPTTKLISFYKEKCDLTTAQAASKLFNMLSMHSLTRFAAGSHHENQMHATLISRVEPLDLVHRNGETATMQPTTNLLAATLHDLKQGRENEAFYWRPGNQNFPGIDGVLVDAANVFVLQATIASEHRSPIEGLRLVWKQLGPNSTYERAWHFVTVVDKEDLVEKFAKSFAENLKTERLGGNTQIHVWGCLLPGLGAV